MPNWLDTVKQVEALEVAALNPKVVGALESRFRKLRGDRVGTINFYTPTFKAYATSEIAACGKSAWPAVSVTGGDCRLQCDHCKAKILEPMIPARTPDDLWRVTNEEIARGAQGMLLTGGSNQRDEVEYGAFYPTIRRIKDAFPGFRIAMHTALVDREIARHMEESGIDAAMMDVIGAQDTVTQVYHLKRPVDDFERSLQYLTETTLKVVPHIVIGLHYGQMLGEWHALEMVARHKPAALVLVVVMPFYAPPGRPFTVPDSHAVGRFFMDAREALPDTPLLLGCARPAGRAKVEIDTYAVLAGLNGIAHPSDGMVELAARLGRDVRVTPTCCSIAVGDEVLAVEPENAGLRVDLQKFIEAERARRRSAAVEHKGLAGIRVVAGPAGGGAAG
jgi:uncharacterized radical SAM superfamily protein